MDAINGWNSVKGIVCSYDSYYSYYSCYSKREMNLDSYLGYEFSKASFG